MRRTQKCIATGVLAGVVLAAVSLVAQPPAQSGSSSGGNGTPSAAAPNSATTAKVSDLAFLAGRWSGTVDNDQIHQVCTLTDPEMMLCVFWLGDAKGTQMVEIYTLRNTPTGVEERVRFLSPELVEKPNDQGLTMKLASYTPKQVVFENPTGTYPKRSTLTWVGEGQFTSRIELIDANGKESLIEAHWTKQ